mgnify:CR=1 FL=1
MVERLPLLVLALARGLTAGLLAHLLLGVGLSLALLPLGDELLPGPVWAWLLGAGLGSGAVWSLAESVGRGRRLPAQLVALLLGLGLTPVALMTGDWLYLLAEASGHTVKALQELLAAGVPSPPDALLGASGAGCLLGPLFLARARGAGAWSQAAAALLGPLLALGAGLLAPLGWDRMSLLGYQGLGLGLTLGMAGGLWVGACAEVRLGRWLRLTGEEEGAPASGPRDVPAARRISQQAEEAEGRGAWSAALELWAEAWRCDPQARRAGQAARAAARGGDLQEARGWLVRAAEGGGRGRAAAREALSDPALAPLRGEPALAALLAAGPGRQRGLASFLALALAHVGLLGLALPQRHLQASVTARALEARLSADPRRLWDLGAALHTAQPPAELSVWLPRAIGTWPALEETDPEAARAAFLRAAEGGHREAMLEAARLCEQEGVGAERPAARAWWRRAAEAGDPQAMARWAEILATGWGGEPADPAAAQAWEERARATSQEAR